MMQASLFSSRDDAWVRVGECHAHAVAMANRHYSRRDRTARRLGGPWKTVVLLTSDGSALWLAGYSTKPMDGLDRIRCQIFRNEGPHLSSDLIRSAMAEVEAAWPDLAPLGWVTWVNRSEVRSANPGYCFLRAGWRVDDTYRPGRRQRHLRRLLADGAAS